MPVRPDPACANHSPGVQLLLRSVLTVSDREQLWLPTPTCRRQCRVRVPAGRWLTVVVQPL